MIVFPNAKINLGLSILKKRDDGYHDIASVMVPVGWCDILEVIRPAEGSKLRGKAIGNLVFNQTGITINGNATDNLVVKAAELFFANHPSDHIWYIHLHKRIPFGAGLGGGSSDAAFTLKALNTLHHHPFNEAALLQMAAQIGSDCPFFVRNQPALAEGRGELLRSLQLQLPKMNVLIAKPDVTVPTAKAYQSIKPKFTTTSPDAILKLPVEQWSGQLENGFENWAVQTFEEIASCLELIRQAGASYSALSGSGAAVFGLFPDAIPEIAFPDNVMVYSGKLPFH